MVTFSLEHCLTIKHVVIHRYRTGFNVYGGHETDAMGGKSSWTAGPGRLLFMYLEGLKHVSLMGTVNGHNNGGFLCLINPVHLLLTGMIKTETVLDRSSYTKQDG